MRPVALDTNAYSAFRRGDADMLAVLQRATELLLSTVAVGELLAGFGMGSRPRENREALAAFLSSPRLRVVPIQMATADHYALVVAQLRRKGRPIPTNDVWIAASALEHGATLLTLDAHFSAIDGLRTGRCLADFLP